MKFNTYKQIGFLFAAFFISGLYAQKFDRKFTENFKVNKDVLVAIKANNADINVTTWNKNEVAVEAIITVEGLSKKEAQKYLNSWDFEALGNQSKVSIDANGDRFVYFGNGDFNFDFIMPDIAIPDMKFDFDFGELNFPEIVMPDIDFDFQNFWNDIEDYEFDGDEERTLTFKSKGKKKTVVIKSKKDWEKFKKSEDYKELKETLHKAKERVRKIDKKKIKEEIKKAKGAYKNINKEALEKSLAKAKVAIEKMKINMANKYKNGDNVIIIENGNTKKKVKITKKINVKVPKAAKFDLNTRHSKVKLPKGKTSGKVSYGTFNSEGVNGGDLEILFAPVDINTLNACTLFLNNVADANFASVTNTVLNSNSSGVKIKNVLKDVDLSNKFGKINIANIIPDFNTFSLILDYTDAEINLSNVKTKLNYTVGNKADGYKNKPSIKLSLDNKNKDFNGNFFIVSNTENVKIKGKHSQLTIKKN